MKVVPIIEKIVEHEGVFYALTKDDDALFATDKQEIANMYFAVPGILQQQAEIIQNLSKQLEIVTENYNSVLMGVMHGDSRIIH